MFFLVRASVIAGEIYTSVSLRASERPTLKASVTVDHRTSHWPSPNSLNYKDVCGQRVHPPAWAMDTGPHKFNVFFN